ncbi:alpha/beta-hydrolase [Daedaleopsis nitida]|nr:alpha/beta-hydrolase [Daedaleopsis nitida]
MTALVDRQPFKTVYLIYFTFTLVFVKIPIWFLLSLHPSGRPRPVWTIKRTLIVKVFKELSGVVTEYLKESTRPTTTDIPDGTLVDAKFVWLKPIPDEFFCGEIRRVAEITGAQLARVGGYWMLRKGSEWAGPKAKPREKTVLHFHGGAFYLGNAGPDDMGAKLTQGLLEHSKTIERTFAVDYRLTSALPDPPKNPFPTTILDALAGYHYLIHNLGFAPENIIVAGDSAGGNIAVGLVRHLLENPNPALRPPARLIVASGWLDLSMSRCGPESSMVRHMPSDVFGEQPGTLFQAYGVKGILGPMDFEVAKTHRYVSPVSVHCQPQTGLFVGFPETYVVAGGAERLLDDSLTFIEKLREDGVSVTEDVCPDACHDFLVLPWHEPERSAVLARIGAWADAA